MSVALLGKAYSDIAEVSNSVLISSRISEVFQLFLEVNILTNLRPKNKDRKKLSTPH